VKYSATSIRYKCGLKVTNPARRFALCGASSIAMIIMNLLKSLDNSLCGALCLIFGWSVATVLHEGFHVGMAHVFGIPVSLGEITLTTGSVFVHGDMTPFETAVVAAVGSVGLVVVGLMLVYVSENKILRMIGVVFLCRAWIDALPICDLDGALVAGSAGYLVACGLVVAEVLACGAGLSHVICEGNGAQVKRRSSTYDRGW
jgi:hypothetical protein